jgi:hypothetical protein
VSNVQEASRIATPAYRQAEAEAIALAIQNYMTATDAGPRLPILAGSSTQHAPLSMTPGSLQMQDGIPSIGATSSLASQVNNMQDGPTVVVPRSN